MNAKVIIGILVVVGGIMFVVCGGAVALIGYTLSQSDQRIALDNGCELYYSKQVDEADAKRCAEFLDDDSQPSEETKITYRLDREDDRYLFGMVMQDGKDADETAETLCRLFAIQGSTEVFDGERVDFQMYDQYLNVIRTLEFDSNTSDLVSSVD